MVTFDGQVWDLGPCCGSFLLAKTFSHQTFSLMLSPTRSGFTVLHVELNHTTFVLYPNLKVSAQDGCGLPGASCPHVAKGLLLGVIPDSPVCGPRAYKMYDTAWPWDGCWDLEPSPAEHWVQG